MSYRLVHKVLLLLLLLSPSDWIESALLLVRWILLLVLALAAVVVVLGVVTLKGTGCGVCGLTGDLQVLGGGRVRIRSVRDREVDVGGVVGILGESG